MEADLDNLTPEQREKVNNFMAITMISNLNHAVQFLEMCNYDLQVSKIPKQTSKLSTPPWKPEGISPRTKQELSLLSIQPLRKTIFLLKL